MQPKMSITMCLVTVVLWASVTAQSSVDGGAVLQTILQRLDTLQELMSDTNVTGASNMPKPMGACPTDFYEHVPTRACYLLITDVKTWYEAREDCHSKGADLIWFDNDMEYRHVVIKLLSAITASKDYNNVGYWTGANDITGRLFWGDTGKSVKPSFHTLPTSSNTRYGYDRSSPSKSPNQKHCVFMTYVRDNMKIAQKMSECDGGRLYMCKCKPALNGEQGCSEPTNQVQVSKKPDC